MDLFEPPLHPSVGTGYKATPNVIRGKFGEGVTQRTQEGIQPVNRVYDVNWGLLEVPQADSITDFFDLHVSEPFQYQFPLESIVRVFTVLSYDRKADDTTGNTVINAQFQEELDPA